MLVGRDRRTTIGVLMKLPSAMHAASGVAIKPAACGLRPKPPCNSNGAKKISEYITKPISTDNVKSTTSCG